MDSTLEPATANRKRAGRLAALLRKGAGWLLGKSPAGRPIDYRSIQLTPEEIASGTYQQYLGGGKERWEERGRFQLHFLKSMGMLPASRFLDIGCGPLRAGAHLIAYLERGHYAGFDSNADFITAARAVVQEKGLAGMRPELCCIHGFDFAGQDWRADYALAFSVLNHCTEAERAAFFQRVPAVLHPLARLYISHASWLRPEHLKSSGLAITRRITAEAFDITRHGWDHRDEIFPILELARIETRASSASMPVLES